MRFPKAHPKIVKERRPPTFYYRQIPTSCAKSLAQTSADQNLAPILETGADVGVVTEQCQRLDRNLSALLARAISASPTEESHRFPFSTLDPNSQNAALPDASDCLARRRAPQLN